MIIFNLIMNFDIDQYKPILNINSPINVIINNYLILIIDNFISGVEYKNSLFE